MSPTDDLPPSPWQRPSASTGREPLDRDRIAREALRLIDAEGIDAVSMRRVATALGTGAASLYAHVANKEALLRAAFDLVVEEITLPAASPGEDWREVVRGWAHQVHDLLVRHNDIAQLTFAHIPSGEAMLETVERLLQVMIQGGVPPQVASWALDIISLYVGADAYEGWLFGQRFGGDEDAPEAQAYFGGVADYFAGLPRERFPYLVDNVAAITEGGGEQRFAFGLDMLIAGIASTAPQPPATG